MNANLTSMNILVNLSGSMASIASDMVGSLITGNIGRSIEDIILERLELNFKGKKILKRFQVIQCDDIDYTLVDENNDMFNISLTFYDVLTPKVGEYIMFSEILFDRKANEGIVHFHFGKLSEPCGRRITPENIDDHLNEILIIERDNNNLCLKRFYG